MFTNLRLHGVSPVWGDFGGNLGPGAVPRAACSCQWRGRNSRLNYDGRKKKGLLWGLGDLLGQSPPEVFLQEGWGRGMLPAPYVNRVRISSGIVEYQGPFPPMALADRKQYRKTRK